MLAGLYTFTTPIGITIGVLATVLSGGTSSDANPIASTNSIIIQGVMDAASAGILLYDALVNLVTSNITHSDYFASLPWRKQAAVFCALWMGAGTMALLGVWI
jgi:zinc transporter 1/2/3